MRFSAFIAFAIALLGAVLPAPAAAADGMTFYIRNHSTRAVALEFHVQGSPKVWPGDDEVYLIEPTMKKSQMIDCAQGENICYGAWLNGNDRITWGVGPDNDKPCEDCCAVCVWKTTTTIDIGQQ